MTEMSGVAERLRRARRFSGLSQAEAARKLDLPQQSILSRYENSSARRVPKTRRLREMAALYGVNFEWLAFGEGEMDA